MRAMRISGFRRTRHDWPFRHGGFTLIELLLVVAVAAALLVVGVPSFNSFIRDQAVKTASFDVSRMLTFARSEAIKRNNDVVVTPASGGWHNGWTVAVTIGGATTVLGQQTSYTGLTMTGPAVNLTYGSQGRVKGATVPAFQISGSSASRCVSVDLSGLPSSKTGNC